MPHILLFCDNLLVGMAECKSAKRVSSSGAFHASFKKFRLFFNIFQAGSVPSYQSCISVLDKCVEKTSLEELTFVDAKLQVPAHFKPLFIDRLY